MKSSSSFSSNCLKRKWDEEEIFEIQANHLIVQQMQYLCVRARARQHSRDDGVPFGIVLQCHFKFDISTSICPKLCTNSHEMNATP